MANTTDKITDVRNAARPTSARVSVARATAGTTLSCNTLTGWPTASKVHFVTYQIDTNNDPIGGSQLDCSGIVSGNTITQLSVLDGTDSGNSIGDVVEMLPTAAWGQDLADALGVGHTRTGAHIASLPLTTPILTTPSIGNFSSANHTHANAAGGGQIANAGISGVAADKFSNPYKFSVYLASPLSLTANTPAKVPFDTKNFDTGTNFDTATNHRFVAPISGFYLVTCQANIGSAGIGSGTFGVAYLYKNGTELRRGLQIAGSGSGTIIPMSGVTDIVQLAANDYLEMWADTSDTTRSVGAGSNITFFSGFLVSAT